MPTPPTPAVPRLTYLRIKNYRALRDVEFRDLTPLTVLIGPNGSGKSTVLDALNFLAEAVRGNLVGAWEKRGRFRGMRTRGSEGNIEFEVGMTTDLLSFPIQYKLMISEIDSKKLAVSEELKRANELLMSSSPSSNGYVKVEIPATSELESSRDYQDDKPDWRATGQLLVESDGGSDESVLPLLTALSTLVKRELTLVRNTLSSYRLFNLTDDHLKGYSDAGPREKLSPNGDNLPNVLYYLHERHPETLARITAQLRRWVPGLADVVPEITSDERLLLRFKDGPFEKPLPAQYMSGGTMRLAALLTLLYEPGAAGLLGIEEPENELHPQLLPQLAEELIAASEDRQLLVATHSPFLLDALEPEQVWILHRGADGYTQATRAADIPGVPELVEDGSPLGYLWSSNSLVVGNPLTPLPDAR
ncbi:AAA family ATPase [Hymenobacter psoromatis]|nr:AAA family ATPase [Hymenobacter psoromatis]